MKLFITTSLILFSCISLITAQTMDEIQTKQSLEKGGELIELAQKAIYKTALRKDIKSLFIGTKSKTESTVEKPLEDEKTLKIVSNSLESNIYLTNFIDKVRIVNQMQSSEDSIIRKTNIFNTEKIFAKWEKTENGEFIDYNDSNKKLGLPTVDYLALTTNTTFMAMMWEDIFPLLIYNFWDKSTQFYYLGKAESSTGQLDVVALVNKDQLSTKFYFDEKTHLLIASTRSGRDNAFISRVFYSNFEEKEGILLPHLIKTETKISNKDGLNVSILEETRLTEFKVNLKLNPKDFEIKEEQKTKQKK